MEGPIKEVTEKEIQNLGELGAASVDHATLMGYVVLARLRSRMAEVAQLRLAAGTGNLTFYGVTVAIVRLYFTRLLPRTGAHTAAARAGVENLMAVEEDGFAF